MKVNKEYCEKLIAKPTPLTHSEVVWGVIGYIKSQGEYDIDYDTLIDKIIEGLVPNDDKTPADTILGEAFRALEYLEYRYKNDGDIAYKKLDDDTPQNVHVDNSMNYIRCALNTYAVNVKRGKSYELPSFNSWNTTPRTYINFLQDLKEWLLFEVVAEYPYMLKWGSNKEDSRECKETDYYNFSTYTISPNYSGNSNEEAYEKAISRYFEEAMA